MRWSPWLAALLLLSGCAAPEGAEPPPSDGVRGSEDLAAPAPASGPSATGDPSAASPADPGTPPAPAGSAPTVPPAPVVASCDVAMDAAPAMLWAFGYGFGYIVPPAEGLVFPAGCSAGELVPSGSSFRSAVIEFDWENAVPMVAVELVLIVRDGPVIVVESAASPIRIDLSDADLPEGPVELTMDYGGTGVYLDFKGTTWFSAFETESPPDGYTALP